MRQKDREREAQVLSGTSVCGKIQHKPYTAAASSGTTTRFNGHAKLSLHDGDIRAKQFLIASRPVIQCSHYGTWLWGLWGRGNKESFNVM